MRPPLLFEALRVTCLHVVLEYVNDSSLTFFIILVSVQRSEESFRYTDIIEWILGFQFLSHSQESVVVHGYYFIVITLPI